MAPKSLVTIRPRRASPILACKKCLSRVPDGKDLRRELKRETKRRSNAQGGKPPRVILTGCFGICPKSAVVLASGATLERGEYLVARDADAIAAAAAALMPAADRQTTR